MKNRFTRPWQIILPVFFILTLSSFLHSQPCDNFNQYFTFEYDGPDTIDVDANCMGTLDWPINTPSVQCRPTFTCNVSFFDISTILTGHNRGDQIGDGQTIDVFYILEATVSPGNIAVRDTFCFSIFFADGNNPTFTTPPPADDTVGCVSQIPAPVLLTAEDLCDASFPKSISPVDNGAANLCSGGTITRIWTAVDSSGNSTAVTQHITVLPDNVAPVIGTAPVSEFVTCELRDYPTWLAAQRNTVNSSATDNCGLLSITDNAPVTFPDSCGIITVTFTVTDSCGRSTQVAASYGVIDTVPPVINGVGLNDTLRLACGTPVPTPPVVTYSDNCTTPADIRTTFTESTSRTNDGSCTDFSFQVIRTWRATDGCDNRSTHRQVIIVTDDQAPTFTVPPTANINCGESTDPSNTGSASGISDNCDPSPHVTFRDVTIDTLGCPYNLKITREWRVTDTCGNTAIRLQTINVSDMTSPSFIVPADTTIACQFAGNLNVTGRPTGLNDNCDPNPTISFTDVNISGSCINSFQILRTWSASDTCGNIAIQTQHITVVDDEIPQITTPAQDMIILCDTSTDVNVAFANWINAQGGAVATDNCSNGPSLLWIARNSGTNDPASLPAQLCPSPLPGILRTQTVDFIVFDQCGNVDTTTATFSLTDNIPPVITECQTDTTVSNDPGLCTRTIQLRLPSIIEECNFSISTLDMTSSQVITSNGAFGDPDILVNSMTFNFTVPGPPARVTGNFSLDVSLFHIDSESPTEFFIIRAEDGSVIGQTNLSIAQCDTSITQFVITDLNLLNAWAMDGVIRFTLEPNRPASLPGRFSVNNICPNADAQLRIRYDYEVVDNVIMEYSVNGAGRVLVNPFTPFMPLTLTLDVGTNEITYYITDCGGNIDSCEFVVTVLDTEAPVLLCPNDVTIPLGQGECTTSFTIPVPPGASDNCGLPNDYDQTLPQQQEDRFLTFYRDPNLGDFLANDRSFTFTGLNSNSFGSGGSLTVFLQADAESAGEFFTVIGENNTVLGTTEVGQLHVIPGSCISAGTATFSISPALLNSWASDGVLSISLISNNNIPVPPGGPGSGINPCQNGVVTLDGQIDSISMVWVNLRFHSITPTYFANGATTIAPTVLTPSSTPTHTFNVGTTNVFYTIEDIHGNADTCVFQVNVVDVEPPQAFCTPTVIRINPGGSTTTFINPDQIDNGSTDNCGIDTMFIIPDQLTCDQINDTVTVKLVVVDFSGNTDTCTTFIRVVGDEPAPSFQYQCGIDTLYLFANPPAAPGNVIYTYRWFGPLGNLISTRENPVITDFSNFFAGNYCVEITGLTGCSTIACVNIPVDIRPPQPQLSGPVKVCWDTDNISLATVPPSGTIGVIEYQWYTGTYPTGSLLGSTSTPSFVVNAPHAALPNTTTSSCFYVVISINGCISQPSNILCVDVVRPPSAVVSQPVITICEGLPLQLGTPVLGTGLVYQWTGPSVQIPPIQNPVVTDSVNSAVHSGNYFLTIFKDGCPSDQAVTIVNVLDKPDQQPNIFPIDIEICEAEEITFRTNLSGVVVYFWESPFGTISQTTTNTLTITANATHNGLWRVRGVTAGGCFSDYSPYANVRVNGFPSQVVAAALPNPVCEGQTLQLEVQPTLSNASYVWMNPNNVVISANQIAVVGNIRQSDAGTYKVMVTNEFGCMKEAIVNVVVSKGVDVLAVSNDAPSCFTGPTEVNLSLIVFPPDNGSYTYQWTGPCGFQSTDSSAVVPNVTAACNGIYSVVVSNGIGCRSVAKTTVINGLGPLSIPQLSRSPDKASYCEGEGLTLNTVGYSGQNVVYRWSTPMGVFTTNNPSLVLDSLTVLAHNGNFSLTVEVDGCSTPVSGTMNLRVNPIPIARPSVQVPCEGGVLRLFGAVSPTGNNPRFIWDTPGGDFAVQNPVITPADPARHNGTYTLTVLLDGCMSLPASFEVEIGKGPNNPVPVPINPFCIFGGDPLQLCINLSTTTPGATYVWTTQLGDTLGMTNLPCLAITDLSRFTYGVFAFFVSANKDGCTTRNPAPVLVEMNTIPGNHANAGSDFAVCENDQVFLAAMPPSGTDIGCWRYLGNLPNVQITNVCESRTNVRGLEPGGSYRFQWCLSNGGCENYSCDTVVVRIFEVENADAGTARIDTCLVNSIRLRAIPSLSGLGRWTQEPVQDQLGIVIVNPNDPNTVVRFPQPGLYKFTWMIPDSVCGGDSDFVLVSISGANPDAGPGFSVCGYGCANLAANAAQNGRWTAAAGSDIIFEDPLDPLTEVCGLREGNNLLIWTIDDGICGAASRDTVIVQYTFAPTGNDDVIRVAFGGTATFDVTTNDLNADNFVVRIIEEPEHGLLEKIAGGSFRYTARLNYIGEDFTVYEICSTDPQCPCSEAVVKFEIGFDINECKVPTIITPNGDNKNEQLSIPCLLQQGKYPENELIIFNQWGDEVFRERPYNNDWKGTYNGENLPDGTYFYVLDLGTGDKPLTGYLVIQR